MKNMLVLIVFILLPVNPSISETLSLKDPSMYLRLHANDAVRWQKWDSSILEQAVRENKLIFISSGFSACHWCHVMRKESFNDAQVAELINTSFIPVKIDRQEQPVLDAYLLGFLKKIKGTAGWPLNILMTPQGYPLTGFVYLDKDSLKTVLVNLLQEWTNRSSELPGVAKDAYLQQRKLNDRFLEVKPDYLFTVYKDEVKNRMDELKGGLDSTVKFPMPYVLKTLLVMYEKSQEEWLKEFLQLTLQEMLQGGLHDPIAGGFFRYTTDPYWETPHFEKMLYVNVSMIDLYLKAYEIFNNDKWLRVAEETMQFLIAEMKTTQGEFISSLLSQDVNDTEGGSYLIDKTVVSNDDIKKLTEHVRLVEFAETGAFLPMGFIGVDGEAIRERFLRYRSNNPVLREENVNKSWNAYLLIVLLSLDHLSELDYSKELQALYRNLDKYLQAEEEMSLSELAYFSKAYWKWGIDKNSVEALTKSKYLFDKALREFKRDDGWQESKDAIVPMLNIKRNIKDGDLVAADVMLAELSGYFVGKIENARRLKVAESVANKPLEYSGFIGFLLQGVVDIAAPENKQQMKVVE